MASSRRSLSVWYSSAEQVPCACVSGGAACSWTAVAVNASLCSSVPEPLATSIVTATWGPVRVHVSRRVGGSRRPRVVGDDDGPVGGVPRLTAMRRSTTPSPAASAAMADVEPCVRSRRGRSRRLAEPPCASRRRPREDADSRNRCRSARGRPRPRRLRALRVPPRTTRPSARRSHPASVSCWWSARPWSRRSWSPWPEWCSWSPWWGACSWWPGPPSTRNRRDRFHPGSRRRRRIPHPAAGRPCRRRKRTWPR